MIGISGKAEMKLRAEVVKKPCALVLHIDTPMETIRRLALFFEEQKVIVEKMQLHRYRAGDAMLIVHGSMDKEIIEEVLSGMKNMSGVKEVERV